MKLVFVFLKEAENIIKFVKLAKAYKTVFAANNNNNTTLIFRQTFITNY
jgi:hypothetical protein